MIEKLMNEDELQALAQRIWAESRQHIVKSVEDGIRTELRDRMTSRAHKLVAYELDKLLRPEIEAAHERLLAAARKKIEHMEQKVGAAVEDQLVAAAPDLLDRAMRELVGMTVRAAQTAFRRSLEEPVLKRMAKEEDR